MSNANKGLILPSGNVRTPKGRMSYPYLFRVNEQKNDDGSKTRKFQLSLVFPKDTDFGVLKEMVDAAAAKKWGADFRKKEKVIMPFLKTEDYPKMGYDAEAYPVFIRLSAQENRPPNIVRADKSNVDPRDEADDVYAGRWAFASVNAYASGPSAKAPRAPNRVSIGLQNVQLLEHDERIGGGARVSAEDEFGEVETESGEKASSTDALFDD